MIILVVIVSNGLCTNVSDVSALASALGVLTSSLRRARTMLWCCLQLGSCDLPSSCIAAAKHSAELNIPSHNSRLRTTAACHAHFDCWKNKQSTAETATCNDVDICDDDDDDDDDDDVFT